MPAQPYKSTSLLRYKSFRKVMVAMLHCKDEPLLYSLIGCHMQSGFLLQRQEHYKFHLDKNPDVAVIFKL